LFRKGVCEMTGFVAMFFLGVLLLVIFDALTGDNDRD
jgi:hypothetical protein